MYYTTLVAWPFVCTQITIETVITRFYGHFVVSHLSYFGYPEHERHGSSDAMQNIHLQLLQSFCI